MSNDTQHYTNFEIFHSLVPKMKAVSPTIENWDELDKKEKYDNYRYIIDAIATAYRSGYGRGQKGRSFLIGEKKAKVKGKKGDKVCWFSNDHDTYYPSVVGTIGTINWVDEDGDLWVDWPFGSCEVNKNGGCTWSRTWCCAKKQCLLIDTNVKGNIKKGDKIVYLGTKHGFLCDDLWPDRVATGVVDWDYDGSCMVYWDNPDVVANRYNGRTHVWYDDIAKVIPWD